MSIHSFFRPIALARIAWKAWSLDKPMMEMHSEKNSQTLSWLVASIGSLKGPVVKIAQMLAMIPGLLPEDWSNALLSLCTQSQTMHWSMVMRRLNQALGRQWPDYFLHIDPIPCFSASLGQVHKGILKDHTHVAVKIQYPAMYGAIQSDLGALKTLLRVLDPRQKSLKIKPFELEWKTRLMEELDYTLEAMHMVRWSKIFENNKRVFVPCPMFHLSHKEVLTMTFLQGCPISEAFHQNDDIRNRLGKEIFLAWYTPFYEVAMIHGDPHMGNMGWDENGLYLFDFGCVRVFSPDFVRSFCLLYEGVLTNNRTFILEAYSQWGFHPISEPIAHALNIWAQFLLKPFLVDQECYLDTFSSADDAKKALRHVYMTLRQEGGTEPPAEFLIFDRVAVILGALLVRLKAKVNWHELMHSLIQNFSYTSCIEKQNQLLALSNSHGILNTKGHTHGSLNI